MIDIINKIKLSGYLENPKIGSFFHMKYPDLFKSIFEMTKEIEQSFVVNTNLRSRVIFMIKYNCNIELIKHKNSWLTFDRKIDDFIEKSENSAKEGWDRKIKHIESFTPLSLNETIFQVKNLKVNDFYGKGSNRKLMSNNPTLYKSIIAHTDILKILNKSSNKFPSKILFLRDYNGNISNLKCEICNENLCLYNENKKNFNKNCKKCHFSSAYKYPQKEWFKQNYGQEWERYYLEDRNKISSYKINSKKWFIEKYGESIGIKKHEEYITNTIDRVIKLKTKKVSKISQEIFWAIYNKLENKSNCFFHELNKEFFIKNNNLIFFPDFVLNKKIIEYDGVYWHNDVKDKIRNEFYKKMGYDVLVITSNEYNRNKKEQSVIEKCLKFLNDENK